MNTERTAATALIAMSKEPDCVFAYPIRLANDLRGRGLAETTWGWRKGSTIVSITPKGRRAARLLHAMFRGR